MRLPSVYVLSHNGMGDNVTMIGCLHFLANFYDNVHFLCREDYYDQIVFALKEFYFIHIIKIPYYKTDVESNDYNKKLLTPFYDSADMFICGGHKSYLNSKITHPYLLDSSKLYKDYPDGIHTIFREPYNILFKNIDKFYDYNHQPNKIMPSTFDFIEMFYDDMNLNTAICFDFFYVNINDEILELYKKISNYHIIFLHTSSSSTNDVNNVANFLKPYLEADDILVISSNHNYYTQDNTKYNIAKEYIMLPTIFHYIEIIRNSAILIMTDSCIACLTLPYIYNKLLRTKNIHIYNRDSLLETDLRTLYREPVVPCVGSP